MPRVLLVDDDRACLSALAPQLRFAFRSQRLAIDTAADASDALMLAYGFHYDALIVGVMRSPVIGFKLIEQLARIQRTIPIIVMSRFDPEEGQQETHRRGFTAFLVKPLNFSRLVTGLAAVLRPYAVRRHFPWRQERSRALVPRRLH